jgi:hypothetical protein
VTSEPEPIRFDSEPEPFHPSAEDLAYDAAYQLARNGELGQWDWPAGDQLAHMTTDMLTSYLAGRDKGYQARKQAELQDELATDAWIREQEAERLEWAYRDLEITDRDMCPLPGYTT